MQIGKNLTHLTASTLFDVWNLTTNLPRFKNWGALHDDNSTNALSEKCARREDSVGHNYDRFRRQKNMINLCGRPIVLLVDRDIFCCEVASMHFCTESPAVTNGAPYCRLSWKTWQRNPARHDILDRKYPSLQTQTWFFSPSLSPSQWCPSPTSYGVPFHTWKLEIT